jgi:ABC-2 type transport system permease protein
VVILLTSRFRSRWFIVPGIVGLLTLVVTMLVTALSVAREREQGTFDQLLVTPYRPWEILIGKAIPGFVIGIAEATLIILVAVFWFQVPLLGSLAALYTGLILFLLSAIGVGLMISSLSVTQQQGLLGAFMFLVPSIILSGFATPILNMPPIVQKLTLINPMRYFMVIVRGVFLEGTPFHLLIDQFWPLALIGMVTLCIADAFQRRQFDQNNGCNRQYQSDHGRCYQQFSKLAVVGRYDHRTGGILYLTGDGVDLIEIFGAQLRE